MLVDNVSISTGYLLSVLFNSFRSHTLSSIVFASLTNTTILQLN